ncbi:MAG: TonB-dependent receptor [Desulfobacteraceae bacterium]
MLRKLILVSVAVMLAGSAFGEESKQIHEPGTQVLDSTVVTATRTDSKLNRIGGTSVTVLTAQDIQMKQFATVEEVIKGIPGIDIAASGGLGTATSVFIRGADSKNTLIMVDGIMYNDPSSSNRTADLGNLTTDNIERIEVVRGPMSVLYGSNATAGVINIITKKGRGKPSLYAGSEGGSYNTWKLYGGASGATEKLNYSLSASHMKTDGFSIANDDNGRIPHAGNTSEDDGWKNSTFSGKLGIDITPDFDINFVGRYQDSETDTDNYGSGLVQDRLVYDPITWSYIPEPDGSKESQVESSRAMGKINVHNFFFDRFLESNFNFQASNLDRTGYDNDGVEEYDYEGDSQDINWQGVLNFNNRNLFIFGAGYFKEEMENASSGITGKDTNTVSFWLQDQLFVSDCLDIVAGIRLDDHEKFGHKTTYRIAPSYLIEATNTKLKASYATGFRSPSLYELYSYYGNESLKPEKSKGWDVGFEQGFMSNKVKIGLTYFDMKYEDRIDYDFATSQYQTVAGETQTCGVETYIQWAAAKDLNFALNYTYNDTEDPDGQELVRRPEHKVHFNVRYRFLEKTAVNLDAYWVDEREASPYAMDEKENSIDGLDEYYLVNLSASYELTRNVRLYGRIDNLFDEFYEECWSYATPGFSAYAGVKLTF